MNYLPLDTKKVKTTANELNTLLADYHVYYQKLRNFHWNIIGKNFFDLHIKFEDMYDDARLKIDEIAERILTLRYQPVSNFSEYLKISSLSESPSDIKDITMVKSLLEDHGLILNQMRKVMKAAEDAGDEGTIDLMGGYMANLEKISWMLDAWSMKTNDSHPEA